MRKLLLLLLLSVSALAQAPRLTDTHTFTTSGTTWNTPNSNGSINSSFEEIFTGAPATVSIVISGCKVGNTCDTLDTYATVANAIRNPTISKVYDYFSVAATWTGGTNATVVVNTTFTTAANGIGNAPLASPSFTGTATAGRLSVHNGSALIAGDFALSASWGTTAAKTVNRGTDGAFSFTVTEGGTGQLANPTFTLTFHDGTWTQIPITTCNLDSATTDVIADVLVSDTATTLVVTYAATPTTNKVVTFQCHTIGI